MKVELTALQQILWFEVIVKAAAGLVLVVLPVTAIRIVGMQRPENGFWPRVLGSVVLGVAGGVFVGLQDPQAVGGIGPAGLIPINLAGAGAMLGHLIMGNAAPSRRGRLFILVNALTLLTLAFLEIAHI